MNTPARGPTSRSGRGKTRSPNQRPGQPQMSFQGERGERHVILAAMESVVRMLGTMVGPHIEVVLHDLTRPKNSIVAITNGHVSNRQVGNSILSGPLGDKAFAAAHDALRASGEPEHVLIPEYPTLTREGQALKSSTVIFRDSEGIAFAALCMNADLSILQLAHVWLGQQLDPQRSPSLPKLESSDLDTRLREIVNEALKSVGKPVDSLGKRERMEVVRYMLQGGLFIVRGGVGQAARALGVSRFTIYNYLDELRRDTQVQPVSLKKASRPRVQPRMRRFL